MEWITVISQLYSPPNPTECSIEGIGRDFGQILNLLNVTHKHLVTPQHAAVGCRGAVWGHWCLGKFSADLSAEKVEVLVLKCYMVLFSSASVL